MITPDAWLPAIDQPLRELCAAEGLSLVGVCDTDVEGEDLRRARSEYREWIARRFHGSMRYLVDHEPAKFDPDRILPGVRSIAFVALNYYQSAGKQTDVPSGRVARYAWGRDYHKELGGRLRRIARVLADRYPGHRFRPFTDATPLAERFYAERAGVGFAGRNTLLINAHYGSWFFIGEILSTLHLPPSGNPAGRYGACPGSCRRCIDVCPTGALYDDKRIDASRCISFLTIEYDGIIPDELCPLIGEWIFGCDLCQEVCPLNLGARPTTVQRFVTPIAGETITLEEILAIGDDEAFTARFAGSPLMRAKRRRLVRNALIVAVNLGARELVPAVGALIDDDDEVISYHARRAFSYLSV